MSCSTATRLISTNYKHLICVQLCSALHKLYKCASAHNWNWKRCCTHDKKNTHTQQPILTIGMESHTINWKSVNAKLTMNTLFLLGSFFPSKCVRHSRMVDRLHYALMFIVCSQFIKRSEWMSREMKEKKRWRKQLD